MGLARTAQLGFARWANESATIANMRQRRYERFLTLCRVTPEDVILDIGAGQGRALERYNNVNRIVAIDHQPLKAGEQSWLAQENVEFHVTDGRSLPFADGEFGVAFSNSVIEHIPPEDWQQFADEVRRVADRYFVQTPNRWFPLEPHYQLPLVQFLPERMMFWLSQRVSMGRRPKGFWEPVRLLGAGDLQRLFPDATIHRERVLGITKSLMAVR